MVGCLSVACKQVDGVGCDYRREKSEVRDAGCCTYLRFLTKRILGAQLASQPEEPLKRRVSRVLLLRRMCAKGIRK